MRSLIMASVVCLAACGAPAPSEGDRARAIAIEHFDEDDHISTLIPTIDGRAWCGMASWPPVEWGQIGPSEFMVEGGRVLRPDEAPGFYRRCGRDFVAPSTIPPVT